MKYKIGIFGSFEDYKDAIAAKAVELGNELGKLNIILITGASPGIPHLVASQAAAGKTEVWGFSPKTSIAEQKKEMGSEDLSVYKKLILVPKDFTFASDLQVCRKYRNVISTATCDGGIIVSGRWGTLNEFTNLHDMGKVIGVLTDTEGIADELPTLYAKIHKKSAAKVIFNSSPKALVGAIIKELEKRRNEVEN